MSLQLPTELSYGVMAYNNRNYPQSVLYTIFSKYGKIQEWYTTKKKYFFVRYKQFEEASACLDHLQNNPDFNARPAKRKEINTSETQSEAGSIEKHENINNETLLSSDAQGDKFENKKGHVNEEKHHGKPSSLSRSFSLGRGDTFDAIRRADIIRNAIQTETEIEMNSNDLNSNRSSEDSLECDFKKLVLPESEFDDQPTRHFTRPTNNNNDDEDEYQPFIVPMIYFYNQQYAQKEKDSHIVVVAGFPFYITEEHLFNLCMTFTQVLRIRLVDQKKPGELLRAYVYVCSKNDALALAKQLDNKTIFNHLIIAFVWR